TRLLPTAGAGGVALALWTLRRAGLEPHKAARTLLAFLVVLYSVFLISIVLSGAALALGVVGSSGPLELSAIPALAATLAVVVCLLASRRGVDSQQRDGGEIDVHERGSRARSGMRLVGEAVRDACLLLR